MPSNQFFVVVGFLNILRFFCSVSPPVEVSLGKEKVEERWELNGSREEEEVCVWGVPPFFKSQIPPDTFVLFINSLSRAVKNQCALHCKQFIMTGDGGMGGGVGRSTATELICLSTITRFCSAVWRRLRHPDKDSLPE